MLGEMRPLHLWLLVCCLLGAYTVLVYPLLAADALLSSPPTPPLVISNRYVREGAARERGDGEVKRNNSVVRHTSPVKVKDFSGLTGWSSDFHISTVKDIKVILAKFNVKLIDKSLSGHCHLTNTCGEDDLRVINKQNGITLSSCPNELRREFYEEYRRDEEFLSVDFYLCTHACSMCELFMPFGKPIVVIASTRYEIGRHDKLLWREWNSNIELLVSKSTQSISAGSNAKVGIEAAISKRNLATSSSFGANILAANNKYDQEYIKYFTGIDSVQLIPSLCETFREEDPSVPVTYQPVRPEILIAPSRDVNSYIADKIIASGGGNDQNILTLLSSYITMKGWSAGDVQNQDKNIESTRPNYVVKHIRDMYPHFKYTDLASHPAVILIPYQISFMLFFELYYMNVPMFVPSPSLLTEWHMKFNLLKERTWNTVYGHPEASSPLPRHPYSSTLLNYDPNDEFDAVAVEEWISLADFYQFPHIIQFNSVEECFEKMSSTNLHEVSKKMKEHNTVREENIKSLWFDILHGVKKSKDVRHKDGLNAAENLPVDLNIALKREYGVALNSGCHGHHGF